MDLRTILKAIELVGDNLPAAKALYEGFIEITRGGTQEELKLRYLEVQKRSNQLHSDIQKA